MQLKSIGIICFALFSNYQFFFFFFKELITGELAKNIYGIPNPVSFFGCGLFEYEFIYNAYPLPGMVGRTLHTLKQFNPCSPQGGGCCHPAFTKEKPALISLRCGRTFLLSLEV